LPFTLELEEATFSNWPGLHSFAFGEWDGKWVFIAGRSNGLHGFFPFTGFPESNANDKIWVMDGQTGELWDWEIAGFSENLKGPLLASNPQYAQHGKHLYIAGGYGKSTTNDDFLTWNTLTAVDLDMLVPAVINGTNPEAAFRQISDDRMQVCGGEMALLEGEFYLVGGHDFAGLYNSNGGPSFTQTYTSEIRRFQIADDGIDFSIENYQAFSDAEFHRRDGSIAPLMTPNGTPALGFYGGVFQPDKDLPYRKPIYISTETIEVDQNYEQLMSQYTCPIVPIFDSATGTMYSAFFGGISLHYFKEDEGLVADSLMPFIDDVSILIRHADGTSVEFLPGLGFGELLGTNAKFILSSDAPHFDNKVLDSSELQGRTMVGFIYGGIKALIPNITPTEASNRLFKVYVTPNISATKEQLQEVHAYIFPNPFSNQFSIHLPNDFSPSNMAILDMAGRPIWQRTNLFADELIVQAERFLGNEMPGVYFLKMEDQHGKTVMLKVVKMRV
jgi:hypothetical protein